MLQFLMTHWPATLIALITGLMLIWPVLLRRLANVPQVNPAQAVNLMNRNNAILLDVREADEVAKTSITQARHIRMAEIEGRLAELGKNKDKPIVVLCQSGGRSAAVCGILKKHGFSTVYNLEGGLAAWLKAGLPVKSGG